MEPFFYHMSGADCCSDIYSRRSACDLSVVREGKKVVRKRCKSARKSEDMRQHSGLLKFFIDPVEVLDSSNTKALFE